MRAILIVLASLLCGTLARADVPCRTSGSYASWLAGVEREAAADGISQRAIDEAAPYLTYDQRIVNIDRGQRVFTQTFLEFSNRMAAAYRITRGQALIKKYAPVFARIERQYGVPAPVIVSFWGLESDFGANQGKYPSLSSIASLAYDCRRADKFRPQLLDALRLIQRGDLTPAEMVGSWAGELGQTQMMPSEYYKYAVDYDGTGKRDLIHDAPDVLGSTANYLVGLGWKRGEPWVTEVHVPAKLPWDQADLDIQLPRAKWASWGVTLADGRPLPDDNLPSSLLLPMGRFGPAFLVYPNFQVYLQWNNSLVYSTTAAYLATRIAGAPPLHPGHPPAALPFEQVKELQTLLVRSGHDVGKIDGFLGLKSRQAVKAMQLKYGLPADSYPTEELLGRMRAGGWRKTMPEQIRRVVTGHNAAGKSTFIIDAPTPHVFQRTKGSAIVHELWETANTPADNRGSTDAIARGHRLPPPQNGSVFRVIEYPPDSERLAAIEREQAMPDDSGRAEATDRNNPRHAGFHKTATIDYAIVLSGEIYAMMDYGEVLLKAGDVLIQRGTNHAWSNRTNEPAVVAFVLIDAEPV